MEAPDRQSLRGVGFVPGVAIFALVLLLSSGGAVWLAQLPSVIESETNSVLAQLAVVVGGLVATISLVAWAAPGFLRGSLLDGVRVSRLFVWCPLSIGAGALFGYLGVNLGGAESSLGLSEGSGRLAWFAAVSMNLVLTPIFEELLFRGVLFSALRQRLSFLLAALLSALVFGVVHLASPAEGATLVGAALWFAFVFESTESLLPCVIGHATMNWVYGLV